MAALGIATKVAKLSTRRGLSRANISAALTDSLRRLQTAYIDLYYAHEDDQATPLEETLQVPLFHRHARGLILTEQGELLYRTARDMAAKVNTAEALLRARRVLDQLHGENPDQDAGIRIVWRALEAPLRQIVANLAENAVKFTDCGYVRFAAAAVGAGLEVRVLDSGAGIPASALPYLFAGLKIAAPSAVRTTAGRR